MPKTFKLEPVRWATWLLTLLIAVETVNEGAHLLPGSWTPYLLSAIALLTLLLGGAVRNRVTPTAAPKDDAGVPLVPKPMAGPPSSGAGRVGMAGW
jgi:hypothetical protein